STTYGPTATAPASAGTYQVTASFAGNANYTSAANSASITISKATPTVSATWTSYTYDGSAHPASGFAYGVGGASDVLSQAATCCARRPRTPPFGSALRPTDRRRPRRRVPARTR